MKNLIKITILKEGIRLFWKRKKGVKECEHDWHELETREVLVDLVIHGHILGTEPKNIMHLYCPKCDKRSRVDEEEGRLLLKIKEIKSKHKQRTS